MARLQCSPGDELQASQNNRYHRNRSMLAAAWSALILLGACQRVSQDMPVSACDENARLAVSLHGAVSLDIDWAADVLSCEGMPRPDGEGARIRLAGPANDAPDASTVAFILGIPGLEEGRVADELGTNVTFMEEGSGRFFGTRDTDSCWTDVAYQEPVPDVGGSTYRIGGTVYCISPLAELNGTSSINFTELEFAGRLRWVEPE
jgi:hypothetical protein